jgi:hypothetical protein
MNRLLRAKPRPSNADLADAAAALSESPSHIAAVPLLLRLSRDKSPIVRAGAVRGMACHPLPAVIARLVELERDTDPSVRSAVSQTEAALDAIPVACLNCGNKPAALVAETSDPHGPVEPTIYPVFCDHACAAEWALSMFVEEARAGAWHFCAVERRWAPDAEAECSTCDDARLIGIDARDGDAP